MVGMTWNNDPTKNDSPDSVEMCDMHQWWRNDFAIYWHLMVKGGTHIHEHYQTKYPNWWGGHERTKGHHGEVQTHELIPWHHYTMKSMVQHYMQDWCMFPGWNSLRRITIKTEGKYFINHGTSQQDSSVRVSLWNWHGLFALIHSVHEVNYCNIGKRGWKYMSFYS